MAATLVRDLRADLDLDPTRFERGIKSAEASAKVFERALREQERAAREAAREAERAAREQERAARAAERAARKQAQALQEAQAAVQRHRSEIAKAAKTVAGWAGALAGLGVATPVVAGLGMAAATLGGAFTAASAGVLAFAKAAGPTLERVQEAIESQDYSKLTAAERDLARSWEHFSQAYLDWQRQVSPAVIPAITGGLGLMERTLPRLSPLVTGTAQAFVGLEQRAEAALNGPFWASFLDQVGRQAPVAVTGLGTSLINVSTGVAGIVNAFLPFTGEIVGGVERATEAFSRWGQQLGSSSEFHQFINFVRANGPLAIELAGNLARAIGNIATAVLPLGVGSMAGLNLLAQLLAGMDPAHIRAIALAIAAIKIGQGVAAGVTALQNLRDRLAEVGAAAGDGKKGVAGKLSGLVNVLGGPWGIAVAAGVTALGMLAQAHADANQHVAELTASLDKQTGALTADTRAAVAARLEAEGVLRAAKDLGLNLGLVTDAALGNRQAMDQVAKSLETANEQFAGGGHQRQIFLHQSELVKGAIGGEIQSLAEARGEWQRQQEAIGQAGSAMSTMGGAAATAASQVDSLTRAMGALYEPTVNAWNAETQLAMAFG